MTFLAGVWCGAALMALLILAGVVWLTRKPLPDVRTEADEIKSLERMVGL